MRFFLLNIATFANLLSVYDSVRHIIKRYLQKFNIAIS